jgi:hypothetical protein
MTWDIFISHAREDKEKVARPLCELLVKNGKSVWLDDMELHLGDSLREKIDEGLSKSEFGVVILSQAFFSKHWTKRELNGLFALEEDGRKRIFPIWHNVSQKDVAKYSPILADRKATSTKIGIENIANNILQVLSEYISPELQNKLKDYKKYPQYYVLLYCIVEEQVHSSRKLFPVSTTDDDWGHYFFAEDYNIKHKNQVFVRYGLNGLFVDMLQNLIDKDLLSGSVSRFELYPAYADGIRYFISKNRDVMEKMRKTQLTDNMQYQFYRDTAGSEIHKLVKELTF